MNYKKKINCMKKYIFVSALSLTLAASVSAQQKDSLLRRQLEVQREYNPTVQDANKITSIPTLREPVVKKANTSYSTWAGKITPPFEIAIPQPSTIMTAIPFSKYKGYLSLEAGNYANFNGTAGYHILDTPKDKLNVLLRHHSTKGDMGSVQYPDETLEMNYMDNFGQLYYKHAFEHLNIALEGGYNHLMYNYYGKLPKVPAIFTADKQQVGIGNIKLGLESVATDWLNYWGNAEYKNFSTKYGLSNTSKGLSGHDITANFGASKPLHSGKNVFGVAGKYKGVFYNNSETTNFNLLVANPFAYFEGFNWKALLGADVSFQLANKTLIRVNPNVELSYNFTEKSSIYVNARGGIDDNTHLNMLHESPFIQPDKQYDSSFSLVDVYGGVKIGELDGFRFDIFGGYKMTDNEHFLVRNQLNIQELQGSPDNEIWVNEFLQPVYGDINKAHAGAMIQTNVWSPLMVTISGQKNFYSLKDMKYGDVAITDAKAYNLPSWEATVRADFSLINRLNLSLTYYMAMDRWTLFNYDNIKMDDIHDLNLSAAFQVNDFISIHAKANNLLGQKYDLWYGYPAQGLNFMGGFTFKF